MSVIAVGPAVAIAGAGYRRWATYRQAAIAGVFVNTVFGVIKLSILLGIADSAGGTVAGYDAASLSTYAWMSQGLIAVVMATLGDLCESVIKRDLGIKDMSQVIPGHGGLMDRLDSLLATIAPIWLLLHYAVFN